MVKWLSCFSWFLRYCVQYRGLVFVLKFTATRTVAHARKSAEEHTQHHARKNLQVHSLGLAAGQVLSPFPSKSTKSAPWLLLHVRPLPWNAVSTSTHSLFKNRSQLTVTWLATIQAPTTTTDLTFNLTLTCRSIRIGRNTRHYVHKRAWSVGQPPRLFTCIPATALLLHIVPKCPHTAVSSVSNFRSRWMTMGTCQIERLGRARKEQTLDKTVHIWCQRNFQL